MKKRGLILFVASLCLLLCALFVACASERAVQMVHSDSVGVLAEPEQNAPLRDINLKIDVSELARPYNARPVNYPSYTADMPEPRVEFIWYKKVGREFVEISAPPTYVGDYRVTVYVIDGVDYTGEDTVDFSITPAYLTPTANGQFPYSGATIFAVDSVAACGEDRIGFEVAFDNPNAGAAISYIRLYGEKAENYRIDPEYTAEILPVELDVSTLKNFAVRKNYDATDLVSCTLDHSVFSGISAGDSVTVVFATGIVDVCTQTLVTSEVLHCENPNYIFLGSADLLVSVDQAIFTPPAEVLYTGESCITLQVQTGLGTDVLSLILNFENANVGAALLANGARIEGEKAGNYRLPEEYRVTIAQRHLQISDFGEIHAKKSFDGTGRVQLSLGLDFLPGVAAGSALQLTGTVSQLYPCEETKVLLRVSEISNPNYSIDEEFEIYLTVEKAILKLYGTPAFAYNGYVERPLGTDSIFVTGALENYPVAVTLVFASAAPGAELARVALHGEYSEYYETDATGFAPKITPARLRFNASNLSFVANGESTRVVRGGRSVWLTAVAQGDEVYALLTFSSAESGATLTDVVLYGADAYKYTIDTSYFTATIR